MSQTALTQVLCLLGTNYHSGQSSRGYRLQGLCRARLKRSGERPIEYERQLTAEQTALYAELSVRYYYEL